MNVAVIDLKNLLCSYIRIKRFKLIWLINLNLQIVEHNLEMSKQSD